MSAAALLLQDVAVWRPCLTPPPRSRPMERVRKGAIATKKPAAPARDSSDAAWIAKVRSGDEEAASALVERLYPTVMRMVRSHLPRRTSEEDLAQTVFAKIFKKLDQFSGLVPLEHWVSRIAINTCLTQLQHEAVRPELRMSDLSEEQEAVIEHLARTDAEVPGENGGDAREILGKLMPRLNADEQLIITLRHLEERSTEEISRLTGWSIPVVKVRAFRARHKMRLLLEKLFQGVD